MNIFQMKKYYHLIKVEQYGKLSLHIPHSEKSTEEQPKKQVEALQVLKLNIPKLLIVYICICVYIYIYIYIYNFKTFRTIKASGRDVYNGIVTLKEWDKD